MSMTQPVSTRLQKPATCVALAMVLACYAGAGPAFAQSSIVGTLTVDGATTKLTQVYVTREASPNEAGQHYVLVLATDRAVAPADRTPDRLAALAASGTLQGVRLRWRDGSDGIDVVPYHKGIAESGRAVRSLATMNVLGLEPRRVQTEFKARMLGQTWFFNALVKAEVVEGGTAVLEPDAAPAAAAAGAGRSAKQVLAGMGYEFTPAAFFQAIGDKHADAVTSFLEAGMSPKIANDQGYPPLNYAVLMCTPGSDGELAVVQALIAGGADVSSRESTNDTTALIGGMQACAPATLEALVKAGANPSVKTKTGISALQLAEIFQRADVAAMLRKAGAQ
jgi:hypothetical protein